MPETSETTDRQQRPQWFKPGQSGNPAGRPKGSRNKLGEVFVAALVVDFEAHGKDSIEKVRTDRPDVYLRVIAQVVPKELIVKEASLEDMGDDELIELLGAVRSQLSGDGGAAVKRRTRKTAREKEAV